MRLGRALVDDGFSPSWIPFFVRFHPATPHATTRPLPMNTALLIVHAYEAPVRNWRLAMPLSRVAALRRTSRCRTLNPKPKNLLQYYEPDGEKADFFWIHHKARSLCVRSVSALRPLCVRSVSAQCPLWASAGGVGLTCCQTRPPPGNVKPVSNPGQTCCTSKNPLARLCCGALGGAAAGSALARSCLSHAKNPKIDHPKSGGQGLRFR